MNKVIPLVAWLVVLQVASFGMGNITDASIDPWYLALTKSSLTPPGYVFGIVWTILYLLLAITGWQLWHAGRIVKKAILQKLFGAQLLLNWSWTPLFFYLHWVGAALACLIAIVVLTTGFLYVAWDRAKQLFGLMLPYWLWVCFASYLNFVIWCG